MRTLYQRLRWPNTDLRGDTLVAIGIPLGCLAVLIEGYGRTELADAQDSAACAFGPSNALIQSHHVRQLERDGIVVIPDAIQPHGLLHAARASLMEDERSHDGSNSSSSAATRLLFESSGNDSDVRQDTITSLRLDDYETSTATETNTASSGSNRSSHNDDGMTYCIHLLRGMTHAIELHSYTASFHHRVPRQSQLAKYCGDGVAQYSRHLDRCNTNIYELGLLEWLRLSDYRGRAVTVILYLNDPDRSASEGGLLRCWLHNDTVLDIVPVGGTLVMFQSDKINHMVLPSHTDRYALTSWVSGALALEQGG